MKHRLVKYYKNVCNYIKNIVVSVFVFFKNVVLSRLILILTIPLIIFNVFCAALIIIKNWSLKNTKELNV